MKAVIGLGNPGGNYEFTRHNAGFWVLDKLVEELNCSWKEQNNCQIAKSSYRSDSLILIKPQTYMNRSGQAASGPIRFYKIDPGDIVVVHDELDLAPGRIQIKQGGSSGGHNGLNDLFSHLSSKAFTRIRVGIGHPRDYQPKEGPRNVEDWVLGKPGREDQLLLEEAVSKASEAALMCVSDEVEAVQSRFNKK